MQCKHEQKKVCRRFSAVYFVSLAQQWRGNFPFKDEAEAGCRSKKQQKNANFFPSV